MCRGERKVLGTKSSACSRRRRYTDGSYLGTLASEFLNLVHEERRQRGRRACRMGRKTKVEDSRGGIQRRGLSSRDIKRQFPKLWRFFRGISRNRRYPVEGSPAPSLSAVTRAGTLLTKKRKNRIGGTNETLRPRCIRTCIRCVSRV